jgi:hypothetical protein
MPDQGRPRTRERTPAGRAPARPVGPPPASLFLALQGAEGATGGKDEPRRDMAPRNTKRRKRGAPACRAPPAADQN